MNIKYVLLLIMVSCNAVDRVRDLSQPNRVHPIITRCINKEGNQVVSLTLRIGHKLFPIAQVVFFPGILAEVDRSMNGVKLTHPALKYNKQLMRFLCKEDDEIMNLVNGDLEVLKRNLGF
ncbi:MAG: hypothetical protein ACJAZS_000601 [Alteromonas naphthalenivorans]|jgi:hypothetical protein